MRKNELYQEESSIIFEQNQFFSDETTHLLHQQFLASYPQLNEKEFNQIIQNVVDCLSALISIFKNIPLKIRQIGVESIVQGELKTFYFQLSKIKLSELSGLIVENEYSIEFDIDNCITLK